MKMEMRSDPAAFHGAYRMTPHTFGELQQLVGVVQGERLASIHACICGHYWLGLGAPWGLDKSVERSRVARLQNTNPPKSFSLLFTQQRGQPRAIIQKQIPTKLVGSILKVRQVKKEVQLKKKLSCYFSLETGKSRVGTKKTAKTRQSFLHLGSYLPSPKQKSIN